MTQVQAAHPQLPPRRAWPAVLVAVGIGCGLRLGAAGQLTGAAEWEADGFVWAWTPASTRALASGCRPDGLQWLWELLGGLTHGHSFGVMRGLAVGLSVLMLACAWELVRVLLRARSASPQATRAAALWLCGSWAVFPALVWSAPRLSPEGVTGGLLCLVAAACLRLRLERSWGSWLWLSVTCALSLACGGLVVAVALTAGLLASLAPIPRASIALPLLGAWLVGAALAVGFDRWHEPSRPWRPDSGVAYGLAALIEAPLELDDREPVLPDRRSDAIWKVSWRTLHERAARATADDVARRVLELVDPRRFGDAVGRAGVALGLVDAFLAGGALLLAAVAVARRQPTTLAAAPRVAAGVALLALALASIVGATGPWALSGLDLLALALASVSLADAGGGAPRRRLAVFLAGGLALTAVAATALRFERNPSTWITQLTHQVGQGSQLVTLLSGDGPADGHEHLHVARLLMDPAAPFLRRPLLAREHAMAALAALPTDDEAVAALVRAQVECLEFADAENLAKTIVAGSGQISPRGRALADWVRGKASRARMEGLR